MAGFYIVVPLLLAAALLRSILAVRAEFKKAHISEGEEEKKSWSRRRIVTVIVASIAIITIIIVVWIFKTDRLLTGSTRRKRKLSFRK